MDNTSQPITQTPTQPAQPTPSQPQQHPFWQHFSKKTLGLILVLLVITAGLLYLALRQEQPLSSSEETATVTPKVSHAYSVLSLVSQTSSLSAVKTVSVHVETNQNKLSGAQINLSYDPTALSNVKLQLGTFFTNPNVLLNTVDAKNGKITLVLGIQPSATSPSGSGDIATISYTVLPTATESTKITFLPKTALTQEGELDSVLKSSQDLTITIPTPTGSLQTLPASNSGQ